MNDDDLLRELRDATRRADAKPTGTSLDEPLDELFVARAAKRIADEQAASGKTTGHAAAPQAKRRSGWPVVAIAAAAAIALLVTRPWATAPVAPLPAYAVAVTGGVDTERAADATSTHLTARAGAPITIALRPATDVTGALAVRVFAARGADVREVGVSSLDEVRVSPSGSIEVRGRAGALAGDAPGDAMVVVVVARDGAAIDARAIAASSAPAPDGVFVGRVSAHVVP